MRKQDACEWRRGRVGWWYPSCRDDKRWRKPPEQGGPYGYCPFCGRETFINRDKFANPMRARKADAEAERHRDVCPSCGERPIQNSEYGWCHNCVARYAANPDDRVRALNAMKAQRTKEKKKKEATKCQGTN